MKPSVRGFELKDIGICYSRKQIFKNLSVTISSDRNWAILGRSGSGKSTLLRILAGLEAPSQGTVMLNGTPVSKDARILVPPSKRQIAMVFQDLALWPNLTAKENVMLGMRGGNSEKIALNTLETCSIAGLASKYPSQMSGGEQQRLALARALAARPDYLFLDEPFNGLDLEIKDSIIKSIKKLADDHNISIILVSHDPFEVLSLCTHAVVLEDGNIMEQGELEALMKEPVSRVMQMFKNYVGRLRTTF